MDKGNLNDFAKSIIQFQKKNDLTDNEMAFSSRISVERLHAIKAGKTEASDEEKHNIHDFMSSKNR